MRQNTGSCLRGAALACLTICMLTGCSQMDTLVSQVEDTWTPEQTTVEVRRDGTVQETIMDTLDRDYYNAGELDALIAQAVSEYNQTAGDGAVVQDEILYEERDVQLKMTYASAVDYERFNQIPFFSGSMLNAQVEGYLFSHEFRKVNRDGVLEEKSISNEEPLSHKEYQVVVSDLSHAVRVPGKIRYLSENAVPVDAFTAEPAVNSEEKDNVALVLPSNEVFRNEEEECRILPENAEEYYMYIIYEF